MAAWALALEYLVVIVIGVTSGAAYLRRSGRGPRVRVPAVLLWLVVAVPSLLQLSHPGLLVALRRDPDAIGDGEVWRLVTSAVVQDGGWPGTVSNLVALAVMMLLAVEVWGGLRAWLLFWACQVVTGVVVVLGLPTVGAGNSIGTLGLGVTMVALSLVRERGVADLVRAVVAVVVATALVAQRDIHGIAVGVGLVLGLASSSSWSSRKSSAGDA